MAHEVELDAGSYGGSYKLIGGSISLDFANLISYRGTPRQHDWLDPAENAHVWARAAGIGAPLRTDIADLREFREILAGVFLAITLGDAVMNDQVAAIGDLAGSAWARRRLQFVDNASAATWVDTAPSLLTEIALDASSLLTSAEALGRIKSCPECRWLFVDTTRNHSRRWCVPADCGNRSRQRRHYRRHT